eukprot:gnl/MRDRNA2_/MRDRNA2_104258_c0_seq1.p1 gnl/MRDRNA2_/MRDRNA2_104258_c0~~gnl/MRDRNA2_/MRDRNA2_104258_c0_seq1.p1  ORF type:complete len:336 (+),score=66.66 gnl/MRDRNA2_/MRDRNA2_104258_c0_seq1:103-1110(+)
MEMLSAFNAALATSLNHTLASVKRSHPEFPDVALMDFALYANVDGRIVKDTFSFVPRPAFVHDAGASKVVSGSPATHSDSSHDLLDGSISRIDGISEALSMTLCESSTPSAIAASEATAEWPKELAPTDSSRSALGREELVSEDSVTVSHVGIRGAAAAGAGFRAAAAARARLRVPGSQPAEPLSQEIAARSPPTWYRVSFRGGVNIRMFPHVEAPQTGETLQHNEIFAVCEELPSPDGRIYLQLADDRGWVFDDSALLPEDPSVLRGEWMDVDSHSVAIPEFPANVQWEPMEEPAPLSQTGEVDGASEADVEPRPGEEPLPEFEGLDSPLEEVL